MCKKTNFSFIIEVYSHLFYFLRNASKVQQNAASDKTRNKWKNQIKNKPGRHKELRGQEHVGQTPTPGSNSRPTDNSTGETMTLMDFSVTRTLLTAGLRTKYGTHMTKFRCSGHVAEVLWFYIIERLVLRNIEKLARSTTSVRDGYTSSL